MEYIYTVFFVNFKLAKYGKALHNRILALFKAQFSVFLSLILMIL